MRDEHISSFLFLYFQNKNYGRDILRVAPAP